MPFFGPNIKKMKKNSDIKGLLELIKHENPKWRVKGAEAIKELNDPKAIEGLVDEFSTIFKYGESDDMIEAMIVIQGRVPISYVNMAFLEDRQNALKDVHRSLELYQVQNILDEVVIEGKDFLSKWFALLTLIELGDRRDEVLQTLINFSNKVTLNIDSKLDEESSLTLFLIANKVNHLIDETVRSIASFRGNTFAKDSLMKILEGKLLCGSYVHTYSSNIYLNPNYQKNAICALGALGDPSTREQLEYYASRGSKYIRKCAEISLANFGRISYDEIKERID